MFELWCMECKRDKNVWEMKESVNWLYVQMQVFVFESQWVVELEEKWCYCFLVEKYLLFFNIFLQFFGWVWGMFQNCVLLWKEQFEVSCSLLCVYFFGLLGFVLGLFYFLGCLMFICLDMFLRFLGEFSFFCSWYGFGFYGLEFNVRFVFQLELDCCFLFCMLLVFLFYSGSV